VKLPGKNAVVVSLTILWPSTSGATLPFGKATLRWWHWSQPSRRLNLTTRSYVSDNSTKMW